MVSNYENLAQKTIEQEVNHTSAVKEARIMSHCFLLEMVASLELNNCERAR